MFDTFSVLMICAFLSTLLVTFAMFSSVALEKCRPIDEEIHWTR